MLDLTQHNSLKEVLAHASREGVTQFLSVCVALSDYPELERIASTHPEVKISVGVHPDSDMTHTVTEDILCTMAANPSCIAIGETGLDYYRVVKPQEQEIQRARFRSHIRAAIRTSKPLIIHTREAANDTLAVMADEHAADIGGVMHCFTENMDIAQQAMDLNFYISISGIVTFKNATIVQEVARKIPLDRLLIETDSPFLAPVPFRGKQNHPALVKYVALAIAELRGISFEEIAEITTQNFYNCFKLK
jgi:TatD DNase family protein